MTLSPSLLAYGAEEDLFNEALAAPRGIRIPCADYSAACTTRHRLNHARSLMRKANTEVFSRGDPGYGTSEWDSLVVRIRTLSGATFVYIEPQAARAFEAIPENDTAQIAKREKPALPAPPLQLTFVRRI